jgi:hypothetical protein
VYPDFKELLLAFNAHSVEYLIVGAHALAAHGHVRATKDFDLWVRPEASNAQQALEALSMLCVKSSLILTGLQPGVTATPF